jgi:hypothetical protein
MPTEHILALLIQERDKLNRAIEALQGTKRRGRPPKSPFALVAPADNGQRKPRTFTAVQRKKQTARMKAYWAAKKKATKSPPPNAEGETDH